MIIYDSYIVYIFIHIEYLEFLFKQCFSDASLTSEICEDLATIILAFQAHSKFSKIRMGRTWCQHV